MDSMAGLNAALVTLILGVFGIIIAVLKLSRRPPTQVTLQCMAHNALENKVALLERDVASVRLDNSQIQSRLTGISAHLSDIEGKINMLLREKQSG